MTQEQANKTKQQKNTLLQYFALGLFAFLAFADLLIKDADVAQFVYWILGGAAVGANPNALLSLLTGRNNEK